MRRKPSDGGDVESVFAGLNKRVWSEDPSYTGSNTTERPKDAHKKACLTFRLQLFIDLLGMPGTRLELVTRGFSVLCSTN